MFKPLFKLFAGLYETLLRGVQKPTDFGKYKPIFGSVGLQTLGVAVGLVLVYYYAFNKPITLLGRAWNRPKDWWLTLLLTAGLGTLLAYGYHNKLVLNEPTGRNATYFGYFLVVNMLVAACWFFLFSILLKFKSEQARTTPFAWPRFSR